jgi:6,7-dimethyl-8-ribityllumazine synthase
MLRANRNNVKDAAGASFAIIASKYNGRYVDAMVRAAKGELKKAGAGPVQVIRVPGAFEIPVVAATLAKTKSRSVILCFGVVFQGQTSHAQHIGWGVTHALAQIQIQHGVPIIHAVFTFEKEEHARVRCLGKKHNRGTEAAQTALEMARVMKAVQSEAATSV